MSRAGSGGLLHERHPASSGNLGVQGVEVDGDGGGGGAGGEALPILGGGVDEAGGYPMLKYDVSLFDPMMKKRLWRGAVNNSGGTAFIQRRMHDMAEAIVNQLRQDGFL